ncbi:MAG: lysozyme [Ignavibacteria bacterium]|nr:lysozyme [Ignavibacteria bacterium]
MTVSQDFILLLCQWESLQTEVYADTSGVPTIGCGHTGSGVKESPITVERAYELARGDVSNFESCVHRLVQVPMTQGMFDALVSMSYNMGYTGLKNTGIPDMMNAGDYKAASERISEVGLTDRTGRKLKGLVKRRLLEQSMFVSDGLDPKKTSPTPSKALTVTASSSQLLKWVLVGAALGTVGSLFYIALKKRTGKPQP